jgi:outer membrane receptor for ferrienterochelin and colicins
MRHPIILFIVFWAVQSLAVISWSQSVDEDIYSSFGGEDFVSIATGQRQSLAKAPAVATVITAKQIKEMGAANLDQVLATVPGLHVSVSSQFLSPIYSIRGIHTEFNPQVLVLVNGTPITQLLIGDRGPRSVLPVSNIARVEVIRGPGSAIYGADAFSGVINVITKSRSQIAGTELGVRFGSFDTQELWLLNGSQWGEVDFTFNLDVSKTDGDGGRVIESDSQSLFDAGLETDVSFAPGPLDSDLKRLDLRVDFSWKGWQFSVWHWRYKSGLGAGQASALDPSGYSEVKDYLVDFSYTNNDWVNSWEFTANLSYMDTSFESQQNLFPPGAQLPLGADGNIDTFSPVGIGEFVDGFIGKPGADEDHTRFDLSAFYFGFKQHTVRMAGGYVYARLRAKEEKNFGPGVIDPVLGNQIIDGALTNVTGTQYIYVPDSDRRNVYGSLQDEWAFADDWQLTLGVRYDYFSDFGSTFNPRAALVWNTSQDITTKLLYGRAFRAPSIGELFFVNNPVILGNEDLKPETINTYEVAFDYRPVLDFRTGLNLFYYQIDDLIEFIPDAGDLGSRTAQNKRGQTGYGFELEANWQALDRLDFAAHYAYQQSEFDNPDEPVGRAPSHQVFGELNWRFFSDWRLNSQVKWIASRQRDFGDPRDEIDDYLWTNLALRRSNIIRGLDAALVVDNLFDVDAFEPSLVAVGTPEGSLIPGDYPLSGRGIYLTISYSYRH